MITAHFAPPVTPQWLSDPQVYAAIQMWRAGKDTVEIAEALGCHESDVVRHLGRGRHPRAQVRAS